MVYLVYVVMSVLGEVFLRQAGASVVLGPLGDGAGIASAMAANQDAFAPVLPSALSHSLCTSQ